MSASFERKTGSTFSHDAPASKAVHYLLYGLLAAEAVLGFVLRWSGTEAMSFFGLLIPPPFAPFSREAHHLVNELHEWIGWAIVIVAAGHALAALFHHYVLRDDVLRRMLPGYRARYEEARAPVPDPAAPRQETGHLPVRDNGAVAGPGGAVTLPPCPNRPP